MRHVIRELWKLTIGIIDIYRHHWVNYIKYTRSSEWTNWQQFVQSSFMISVNNVGPPSKETSEIHSTFLPRLKIIPILLLWSHCTPSDTALNNPRFQADSCCMRFLQLPFHVSKLTSRFEVRMDITYLPQILKSFEFSPGGFHRDEVVPSSSFEAL